MNLSQSNSPTQICEGILEEKRRYNIEHCIWPSENRVIGRMLARTLELVDAYDELNAKLGNYPNAVSEFLDAVLATAVLWNQDKIAEARATRDQINDVNRRIAIQAEALAVLLSQREELHNDGSGFWSETHYHPLDVIEAASEHNPLFAWHVQKGLDALRARYDLKYWPSLSDCIQVLADDARAAQSEASDPITAAATEASRASLTDVVKALFTGIEERGIRYGGFIPNGFRPTDSTVASLMNCALDLGPDSLIDGPYVKQLRQRLRNKPKSFA